MIKNIDSNISSLQNDIDRLKILLDKLNHFKNDELLLKISNRFKVELLLDDTDVTINISSHFYCLCFMNCGDFNIETLKNDLTRRISNNILNKIYDNELKELLDIVNEYIRKKKLESL